MLTVGGYFLYNGLTTLLLKLKLEDARFRISVKCFVLLFYSVLYVLFII